MRRYLTTVQIFMLAGLVICIILLSLVPPVSRDALIHHLTVPKIYLAHGVLHEIPFMFYSYFPMNVTLLYMIPLAFGDDIAPQFIHFSFACATASLIFLYLRDRIGKNYALLGALLFLSVPIIIRLSITAYAEGSRILLNARVLDMITLGIWMIAASLFSSVPIDWYFKLIWTLAGVSLCMMPVIVKIITRLGIKIVPGKKATIEIISKLNFKKREILQSFGIWGVIAGCQFCVARSIGIDISFQDVWFLITLQLPLQLIPIQGVANSGNHEGGWFAALVILEISTSEKIQIQEI